MQHELFKVVMGKYPPPMNEVLADVEFADQKAVLDLGCGSGSWILEVARDYPSVSCVGVDLVPMQSSVAPHVVGHEIVLKPATREQELPPNMRQVPL